MWDRLQVGNDSRMMVMTEVGEHFTKLVTEYNQVQN